jgi:hypothetical protein
MDTYTPPKPPAKPADYTAFMSSLSPKERELHEMGEKLLGSSYFVQWTHGYRKWKASLDKKPA